MDYHPHAEALGILGIGVGCNFFSIMKRMALLIVLLGSIYLTHHFVQKRGAVLPETQQQSTETKQAQALAIVYYQDVSGSMLSNGVELISAQIFQPYFNDTHRDIELHFGVIDNRTAGKLISIALPAQDFAPPVLLDLRKLSITEKRQEKARFLEATEEHKMDSARYFQVRNQSIEIFCARVESTLAPYRKKLSTDTDLLTSLAITDRIFAYSLFTNTRNYLLINSDGLDSGNRKASKMKSRVEVILINAGRNRPTSVDSIVTLTLRATEQAIAYTLFNNKN